MAAETVVPDEKKGRAPVMGRAGVLKSITSFANILWRFSKADIATFVAPTTSFGTLGALSGPLLTTNSSPAALHILARTPLVALFVWTNLLVFDIANQRLPEAILEDSYNEPSRPLPSGLISCEQARRLLRSLLPLVLGLSYFIGVWKETSLLFTLTWIYNDLKGGDEDFVLRQVLLAAAFGLYNEGALRIACGHGHVPTESGFVWTAIVSAVIFSTMHVQDLKDQVGDLAKGRRSAPIVLGDLVARWTVAIPVAFWSLFCPLYWGLDVFGCLVPVGLGSAIGFRTTWFRGKEADHTTWLMWAGWLITLYFLSVAKTSTDFASWVVT